jgi:hypothetical protein
METRVIIPFWRTRAETGEVIWSMLPGSHRDSCSSSFLEYLISREGKPFETVGILDELMAWMS